VSGDDRANVACRAKIDTLVDYSTACLVSASI